MEKYIDVISWAAVSAVWLGVFLKKNSLIELIFFGIHLVLSIFLTFWFLGYEGITTSLLWAGNAVLGAIVFSLRLSARVNKKTDHYMRGYDSANFHIGLGKDAQSLLNEAKGDLDPDDFTKGWKKACNEHIK